MIVQNIDDLKSKLDLLRYAKDVIIAEVKACIKQDYPKHYSDDVLTYEFTKRSVVGEDFIGFETKIILKGADIWLYSKKVSEPEQMSEFHKEFEELAAEAEFLTKFIILCASNALTANFGISCYQAEDTNDSDSPTNK